MCDGGYRHLPVVVDGKVVGIVSRSDFKGLELTTSRTTRTCGKGSADDVLKRPGQREAAVAGSCRPGFSLTASSSSSSLTAFSLTASCWSALSRPASSCSILLRGLIRFALPRRQGSASTLKRSMPTMQVVRGQHPHQPSPLRRLGKLRLWVQRPVTLGAPTGNIELDAVDLLALVQPDVADGFAQA